MSNHKIHRYNKIGFLGEGQYALVYKAKDSVENIFVAIKKIKIGVIDERQEGINHSAIREIKILRKSVHENIIRILDVFGSKDGISLVYDYMETDLLKIIEDPKSVLSSANIKSYILMTLKGLEYLHSLWILHRDLKPSNLLIDRNGVLKLGDFGLARKYGVHVPMTSVVVTRWYRSPELLFGSKFYGAAIDIWSVGCIAGELLKRTPLFSGDTDLDQLSKIFSITGTPTENDWPGITKLPDYIEFKKFDKIQFSEIFSAATDDMINILDAMLTCNPNKRINATDALQHEYFRKLPNPTPPHLLLTSNIIEDKIDPMNINFLPTKRSATELESVRKKLNF